MSRKKTRSKTSQESQTIKRLRKQIRELKKELEQMMWAAAVNASNDRPDFYSRGYSY